jgi:hypothetical protein
VSNALCVSRRGATLPEGSRETTCCLERREKVGTIMDMVKGSKTRMECFARSFNISMNLKSCERHQKEIYPVTLPYLDFYVKGQEAFHPGPSGCEVRDFSSLQSLWLITVRLPEVA